MKRSTFRVLFFLKRDKQKSNGLVPLYCRITVDGDESRFGMKCDVNPNIWDVKTAKATGRTTEASKINSLVDATKATIYKIYRDLQEKENYVTAEKIKNIFLGIEQKNQTLLELFDCHNQERKIQVGINLSKGTFYRYCYTRKQLADFLLYKYNQQDIAINEVNKQFISDFETYLIVHHNYSSNTLVSILKKFRHIIEVALNKEWIHKNPFNGYKLQWQKTDRGYLTQSEIETLISYRFEDKYHLERTRDIFIFCVFTGLSYTDVKHLTYENIQSSVDEKLWIRGKRLKTDIEYNIPLLSIPKMIIEKYRGRANNNLVLPVCNIITYNDQLKEIAKLCGINKHITSHVARHTFATFALTKGVSIESVSKMLGHSNIKTTQIYAKITNKKIGNEMNLFAEKINEIETKSVINL
jgi:site-specific recombinase XerD